MNRYPGFALTISLVLLLAACAPQAGQTATPQPPASAWGTPTVNPDLPITDAGVPRVSAERAKAALDAGQAVIVDVRTAEVYASKHITGAVLIPLAEIERNPGAVPLDKTKWIITYCT